MFPKLCFLPSTDKLLLLLRHKKSLNLAFTVVPYPSPSTEFCLVEGLLILHNSLYFFNVLKIGA